MRRPSRSEDAKASEETAAQEPEENAGGGTDSDRRPRWRRDHEPGPGESDAAGEASDPTPARPRLLAGRRPAVIDAPPRLVEQNGGESSKSGPDGPKTAADEDPDSVVRRLPRKNPDTDLDAKGSS